MSLLRKFLNNSDGSLAIQLSVLILPLLGLIGAAVDYSRVAMVKTSLQATLDNNVRTLHHTAFRNRAEMEEYIVSMAEVNLDSNTIASKISISKDKIRIDLKDQVKTPVLSIVGRPKVEVAASVEIDQRVDPSENEFTTKPSNSGSTNDKPRLSRAQINEMKLAVRKRLSSIKAYKNLSPARKRRILRSLNAQLENLKQL